MTRLRLLPLMLAVAPAALPAQGRPDSRWLPWLGCWQVGEIPSPDAPLVCVRPASDPLGVEVATVTGRAIAFSRTLVADERPHDLTLEDCTGSQLVGFSADGRRVFLRSTLTCAGGQRRTASAVMAMASPTVWLDAQSLGMEGERVPRVLHYHPAPFAEWPDDFMLTTERAAAVSDARALAAGRLSLPDIREAASRADPEAVAAFLLERNQRFDLTAAELTALDDAATPDAVIDALVAVSYPERFAVDREGARPALRAGERAAAPDEAYDDPYGWGWWGYGSCSYSRFCDPYYDVYGAGLGYWPFGYDPSWSGGYWGPVFIVPRDRVETARGAAVRGRGYTRGGQPAGTDGARYARPRSGTAPSGTAASPSPSVYGGATSSAGAGRASPGGYSSGGGSSSSSGGSSGTAKPKGNK